MRTLTKDILDKMLGERFNEPECILSFSAGKIDMRISTWHWLNFKVVYNQRLDDLLHSSKQQPAQFGKWLIKNEYTDAPVSVSSGNTKNSLLDTDFQFCLYSPHVPVIDRTTWTYIESGNFVLLGIPGKKLRAFSLDNEFNFRSASILCDSCVAGWHTKDGHFWHTNENAANPLPTTFYPIIIDTEYEGDYSYTVGQVSAWQALQALQALRKMNGQYLNSLSGVLFGSPEALRQRVMDRQRNQLLDILHIASYGAIYDKLPDFSESMLIDSNTKQAICPECLGGFLEGQIY